MADRRPEEELYNIRDDPWEVKNLAGSDKHQDALKTMRGRLEAWIKKTGDKGRFPEKKPPEKQGQKKQKPKKGKRKDKAGEPEAKQ